MPNLAKIRIKHLPTFLAITLLSFSSISNALAGSLTNLHGFVSRGDFDVNHDTALQVRGPIQSSPVSDGDHFSRLFLSPFVAPGAFSEGHL